MTITSSIHKIIDQSKEYISTKIELTRLKAVDKASDAISDAIVTIIVMITALIALIFFSVAIAIMFRKIFGSYEYGFFIVGGFYFIVFLILFIQRKKWLKRPIENILIDKILK